MSSSTTILFGSIAAGLLIPQIHLDNKSKGTRLAFGVNVGTDWISGKREISRCSDCRDEDFDLRGGMYIEPTLQMYISGGAGIGVYYRNYTGHSDIRGRFIIKFIYAFSLK